MRSRCDPCRPVKMAPATSWLGGQTFSVMTAMSAAEDAKALAERAAALHKKLIADVSALNPDTPELRASSLLQETPPSVESQHARLLEAGSRWGDNDVCLVLNSAASPP